jgi:hypothetical protein
MDKPHGTRLGREHHSVRRHVVEDHDADPRWAEFCTDGALHGYHDGRHRTTWAYAYDLPHRPDASCTGALGWPGAPGRVIDPGLVPWGSHVNAEPAPAMAAPPGGPGWLGLAPADLSEGTLDPRPEHACLWRAKRLRCTREGQGRPARVTVPPASRPGLRLAGKLRRAPWAAGGSSSAAPGSRGFRSASLCTGSACRCPEPGASAGKLRSDPGRRHDHCQPDQASS